MDRTNYIRIRVSDQEKAAMQKAAKKLNMSLSEYIRYMVLSSSISVVTGSVEDLFSIQSDTAESLANRLKEQEVLKSMKYGLEED